MPYQTTKSREKHAEASWDAALLNALQEGRNSRVKVHIRADAVNNYNKFEHKFRKDLKALNKQNKMLSRISKIPGSRRELKMTKNIKAKASKTH